MSAPPHPIRLPLEIHAGVHPPAHWQRIAEAGIESWEATMAERAGRTWQPPALGQESIDWDALGVVPRYVGDEAATCVAALQPGRFHNDGAVEFQRYLAGAHKREETALVVSLVGDPDAIHNPLFKHNDGIEFRGNDGIGARSLPTGGAAEIVDSIVGPDRDLGLRLRQRPDDSPWWALDFHGRMQSDGGFGTRQVAEPVGTFQPILTNVLGETVAGVWVAPETDQPLRWYVLPAGTDWEIIVKWLTDSAIPEFVPGALRRSRAGELVDDSLLTVGELQAKRELDRFEEHTNHARAELEEKQRRATAEAETIRAQLLYGTGAELVGAVRGVLEAAGYTVVDLDELFGMGRSADLLASRAGRHRLVEVKSAAGSASERLFGDLQRHVQTWPELGRPERLSGAALVINHQCRGAPTGRSSQPYGRPEFLASLTHPVIPALALFTWWRDENPAALVAALEGAAICHAGDLATRTGEVPGTQNPPARKPSRFGRGRR